MAIENFIGTKTRMKTLEELKRRFNIFNRDKKLFNPSVR